MGVNTTSTILMIRPVQFRYNEQTAVNNYYQKVQEELVAEKAQENALDEFDQFVEKLEAKGVEVVVVSDTLKPDTPDSIFPNNWVSFHHDGAVALYPMYAENRRMERREEILDKLEDLGYFIEVQYDFTNLEEEGVFLEGTGSLVLDRENKIAYAVVSERTNPQGLHYFATEMGFKVMQFEAFQTYKDQRLPIYHTNVMMAMGDGFVVICLDSIDDPDDRAEVIESLEHSDKEIIEISEEQKERFAGNMLQVENKEGVKYMVMSESAFQSLDQDQKDRILSFNEGIIHSSLDTIELLGGGSARCMMAEVFLPKQELD
ncbi:MAG: arginine deiminase-related protein [Reichenbachiella sp.]